MNNGYEIKADLVIALQTMDAGTFKAILEKSSIPFTSIIDHNSSNIFHELASTILPDSLDLDLLQIYIANFYKNHSEKTTEMIKFQINQQTLDEGLTPVMIAANCNKIVLLKEFFKLGAQSNVKNKKKQSLMHLACMKGYVRLVTYLKYDLDTAFEDQDEQGMTPGHLAIKEGKEAVAQLLISWDIDLQVQDMKKNTMLHYAAMAENPRIARILIMRGASRKSQNIDNKTPYDLAQSFQNKHLMAILVKFI